MLELNLKNRAATQTTARFNSMCRIGNTFVGATSSGLYRMCGTSDNGVEIPAMIRSGLFDLGTPAMKRFRFFYFWLYATGQLLLRVYCDDVLAGEYRVDCDGDMRVCVPISRAHKGRYWAWSIENVGGAFFSLYSVQALPVVLHSGRR
jgi:hypothetical protein